jgi:2-dehydro-3-deoxyphosphogluconate aldolase/(4S)-4-hydroxy-2-oxoglutarate aldolase
MNRSQTLDKILDCGVMAIIRMQHSAKVKWIAGAIAEGGITAIEVTMSTPDALSAVQAIAQTAGDSIQIGVGSVMNKATVFWAYRAGAQFIVSPVFKSDIIQTAHELDMVCIPGCYSPTEIWTAYEAGADLIKVFPADVLGMDFIRAIKAPMPDLSLMPTGGVTSDNAEAWMKTGASCVGVGAALLDKKAIDEENYALLTENARQMKAAVDRGREK